MIGVFAVALTLGGCATIDHIAPRAAQFNTETSNAKTRSIFANILRAADGQPLQFTDVTTFTGTGDVEGSLSAELPVKVDPSTVERTWKVTPSAKLSAGSQFNVANLNTQEFYYGLQAPVKVEHIANFIAAGYDPSLVLFLMIDEIEVTSPRRRMVIRSDTRSPVNYIAFRQAINFLIEAGLSTKRGDEEHIGPSLNDQQVSDPKILATLLGTTGGKFSLEEEDPTITGSPKTYRLAKDGSWGFCFDPLKVADKTFFDTDKRRLATWASIGGMTSARVLDISNPPQSFRAPLLADDKGELAFIEITQASLCHPPKGAPTEEKLDKVVLKPRSVEGIFQFLGEVARAQIASPGALGFPRKDADGKAMSSFFPFRIVKGEAPTEAAITIKRGMESFSIIADPAGNDDQSTRVLQILTDLLALQSSSKDLPTPSAISVITR
jgi:hypothetical protein